MKKRKIKKLAKVGAYVVTFSVLFAVLFAIENVGTKESAFVNEDYEFVNSSIFNSNIPVTKEEEQVVAKPFVSDKVEISKNFYDKSSSDEEKRNSILYYKDTYMQNSGILYKSEESFDVVTILDGVVLNVKTDDILGSMVQVKYPNNLIGVYQGLSTVNVKKDQLLKQGDILGKSGKLELGETLENALLFELIKEGKYVNPSNYYDKKANEI